MKLSIIIVNYNVKYFTEQCLKSLADSDVAFGYEIIVVDNNSSDNSVEYLQQRFTQSHIRFISNLDNPGFAVANNQAINTSKGDYILLLNPDTVLGEQVLANACRFMDCDADVGGVGLKMINGWGCFLPESKRGFPNLWASFCKIFGLASILGKSKLFGQYNLTYLDEKQAHQIPILAGAFMLIRKKVLDEIGLLDEAFFMYGEDIDLSYRITKAGYKNYYLPQCIIHYKGESTDKNNPQYEKAFYDAMHIFYRKHYPQQSTVLSAIISAGINLKAFFVKFICKNKKNSKKTVFPKKIVTFDKTKFLYEDIIKQMDSNSDKNTLFYIYYPETGITIGTNYTEKKE